jgi:hypothetical protein
VTTEQLELSDATQRQRKKLIIITLILIFINHAGLEFGDELKLFGASATISNPDFILISLLLSQAYLVWRFYQYFHHDKAYGAIRRQYKATLYDYFQPKILKEIFRRLPRQNSTVAGNPSYSDLKSVRLNLYEISVEVLQVNGDGSPDTHRVFIPKHLIELYRLTTPIKFLFRGKILTDFYLPFILVAYSTTIQF